MNNAQKNTNGNGAAPKHGAGGGIGALLVTMMWGVRRGLFSNEAGQGSAPIAHAAAKTDEPVSEGAVALLEPFIDTIIICSMTGLVIIMTGVWDDRVPTRLPLDGGNISYVAQEASGRIVRVPSPAEYRVQDGYPVATAQEPRMAWHDAVVERFFTDEAQTVPFTGTVRTGAGGMAAADDGQRFAVLYGNAAVNGAPLTMLGFQRGLPGEWGRYIVLVSVLLFAVSTAISWSYYGDRCANYLFGPKAILPYKLVFVGMHFFGAMVSLSVIWDMGDIALGIVILPNLLALILLSGKVKELTDSYFTRKPWLENYEAHKRALEEKKAGKRKRVH
jgi:AGCS family alanine or glycine:cation symporter